MPPEKTKKDWTHFNLSISRPFRIFGNRFQNHEWFHYEIYAL